MKIREDYVLRQVADTWVVLPLGQASLDFDGMLTLNAPAAFLWEQLEEDKSHEELVDLLLAEYEVSRNQASADVSEFIEFLSSIGCLID